MNPRAPRNELELVHQAIARHHQFVYRLAFRTLRNEADAEDLTQTVFLRLMRSPGAFSRVASQKAWLARMTFTQAVTWLRSESRRRRREESWARGRGRGGEGEVMKAAEAVQAAVSSLPDKLRIPVVLH